MLTKLITFEGEARSGKGTSVRAVRDAFGRENINASFIDQGQKFRAFAKLATERRVNLNDTDSVDNFINDSGVREEMLELLATVSKLTQSELDALLYTQEIGSGSAKIGGRPDAQNMIVDLLHSQVQQLIRADSPEVIIIDGRDVASQGRIMQEKNIANFVLGFYFRCDTAVAARRTEGIFVETASMTTDEKLQLLDSITRISDRNRQDALRAIYPMREPTNAYPLHTSDFRMHDETYIAREAEEAFESGIISIDTSYTRSVKEMTDPVVVLTLRALDASAPRTQA
jgi:cytidylate kinase